MVTAKPQVYKTKKLIATQQHINPKAAWRAKNPPLGGRGAFNAKEQDPETGNYYYGARYYNPQTSIWFGVDPLAAKYPHVTPYNFVEGNPIMLIDPDGNGPIIPPDLHLTRIKILNGVGADMFDSGRNRYKDSENTYWPTTFMSGCYSFDYVASFQIKYYTNDAIEKVYPSATRWSRVQMVSEVRSTQYVQYYDEEGNKTDYLVIGGTVELTRITVTTNYNLLAGISEVFNQKNLPDEAQVSVKTFSALFSVKLIYDQSGMANIVLEKINMDENTSSSNTQVNSRHIDPDVLDYLIETIVQNNLNAQHNEIIFNDAEREAMQRVNNN